MCNKLEDNNEYLIKSVAVIVKIFHKFFEETTKCLEQR